jgi:hypothetical protein
MSHLTLETLARLIDDAPDPTETGHLDICPQCRDELEALRADSAALHMLPDPEPSIAQWVRLESRLEREGLIRRNARWQPAALRMAAAIVIFVLGGVAATLVTRPRVEYLTADPTPTSMVAQQPPLIMQEPAPTLTDNTVAAPAPVRSVPVAVAVSPPRTPEEAATRLRTAENDYVAALARFAELSGRSEEGDPLARLAALESIVATTRAALGRAPADPVINGYHLTAVAQRDALLRQVNASGPTWY